MYRYFKVITNTNYVSSSKGLSDESFKPPTTSDNSLNPTLNILVMELDLIED